MVLRCLPPTPQCTRRRNTSFQTGACDAHLTGMGSWEVQGRRCKPATRVRTDATAVGQGMLCTQGTPFLALWKQTALCIRNPRCEVHNGLQRCSRAQSLAWASCSFPLSETLRKTPRAPVCPMHPLFRPGVHKAHIQVPTSVTMRVFTGGTRYTARRKWTAHRVGKWRAIGRVTNPTNRRGGSQRETRGPGVWAPLTKNGPSRPPAGPHSHLTQNAPTPWPSKQQCLDTFHAGENG